MKAVVKQIEGLSLAGKADSNHWVPMDSIKDFGGAGAGTKPMELILLGLGGCTGMDVISILKKKRSPIDRIDIELNAEQSNDFPKVFTKIKITFLVYGDKENIKPKDVERAIELSRTQYCSVSNMLKTTVKIDYDFEIIQA